MTNNRIRLAATLLLLLAVQTPVLSAEKQPLRPEVGKALQAAQTALQAKNYAEAKTQIGAAEAVGKLTPYESYIVARLKSL